MQIKHLLLVAVAGAIFSHGEALAQGNLNPGCYTDEMTLELEKQYPNQKANRQALEIQIQQYISQNKNNKSQAGPVLKIPIVFHIVTEKGLDGVSKAQMLNGMEMINQDFRRNNADTSIIRQQFKNLSADMEIEFVMARKDPQGNPTEGIVRTTSITANGPFVRNDVKAASPAWPTDKYLNVWVVKDINGDVAGYAQFPGTGVWTEYGVVLDHRFLGKIGGSPGSTATSTRRTFTHEIGHCLNLYHTFQGNLGASKQNEQTNQDKKVQFLCENEA